jgi:hypothetical protein
VEEVDEAMLKRGEERARTMEQANGHSARKDRGVTKQNDIAKQGDSMTLRQRAMKDTEVKERAIWAKEAKERKAKEREAAQARVEMEKAKADAIEL